MNPQDFLNNCLKQGQFPPVLLFNGKEDYWKQLHLKSIKKHFLKPEERTLNFFTFDAGEDNISKVISEANSLGFFGAKKLIHFKNIELLNQEDQKTLMTYVDSPLCETLLILDTSKLDGKSVIGRNKALKNHTIEYHIKGTKDITQFIRFKLKQMGDLKIETAVEQFLMEAFPENLRLLSNNLEKMAAHSGYAEVITQNDLKVVNSVDPETSNFSFLDAVIGKKTKKALSLHRVLSKHSDNVFMLIGLLRWQFKNFICAKQMLKEQVPIDSISETLKILPFKRKQFFEQLQKRPEKELLHQYGLIADCDYRLKSSSLSQSHLFEMLIYRLCI